MPVSFVGLTYISVLLLLTRLQQRLPQKKSSEEEVKRILTPIEAVAVKIITGLSHKPTIRIMGATGEGKGVMARYLVNHILATNNWYTRLHDPQHGSSEDHWGMPKVSKSGSELKDALAGIDAQMHQRERDKNWSVITLDYLDVDSTPDSVDLPNPNSES